MMRYWRSSFLLLFPGMAVMVLLVIFIVRMRQGVPPDRQRLLHDQVLSSVAEAQIVLPNQFTDITDTCGVDFLHEAGPIDTYFFPQIMGSGGALFDFDQDGDLDLYLIQGMVPGHSLLASKASASKASEADKFSKTEATVRNQLFRQESDGRFRNISPNSGLDVPSGGMGIAIGDVNNDGLPDVYLANFGPDQLLLNLGDGKFRDISVTAGTVDPSWGASACFLDFDRDGWLDLCVANYVDYDPGHPCLDPTGKLDYCNPKLFGGTATRLYRNRGSSQKMTVDSRSSALFEDVSLSSGIAHLKGPGLGVTSVDVNLDGWPDLFVANDGAANHLWMNQKDGTFREEAIIRGGAYDNQGRPQAGMGIAPADIDSDGDVDLFLTHLRGEYNTLYLNDPRVGFADLSTESGLALSGFATTGFGTAWLDLELDGDVDLVVVNGDVRRFHVAGNSSRSDDRNLASDYGQPNQLYVQENPLQFREIEPQGQAFCEPTEVSRALLTGDLDNDGDVDLVVTNAAGKARIYRNDASRAGHWLTLRITEPDYGNRDAYGARVTVELPARTLTGWVNPGSSYLCSHDPRLHFGLGQTLEILSIRVVWPSGAEEIFPGGQCDQIMTLRRGQGRSP